MPIELREFGKKIARTSVSFDEPCPAVLADGIGGVCRRGQYNLTGAFPSALDGVKPREGDDAETAPEFFAMPIEVEKSAGLLSIGGDAGHAWRDVTDAPMPAVVASRPVRVRSSDDDRPSRNHDKPPYRVPSMAEVRAVEPCGLNLVSTFSGCGGSCLGFRMEGFKVLWANEFVPAARDAYLANCDPATIMDDRDIRLVQPNEVTAAIGGVEVDVLEGSPPCASFSTAGKRAAGWGSVRSYSDTRQRVDDLFFEFARILDGLRPRAFVAENVSGLVKGAAKGWFLDVLAALKRPGYRVKAKLLDAQWLGVPQARQRIIFVGLREDLGIDPEHPAPMPHRYSLRDACPWIVQHGGIRGSGFPGRDMVTADHPSMTVMAGGGYGMNTSQFGVEAKVATHKGERSVDEPVPTVMQHGRLSTFNQLGVVEPEADVSRYAIGRDAASIKEGGKSARYINSQRAHRDRPSPTITTPAGLVSAATVLHPTEVRRFSIAELKRVCAFPDDFVLTGTYAQQWERLGRSVPPLMMRAVAAKLKAQLLATK